jgi:hypothetical protein
MSVATDLASVQRAFQRSIRSELAPANDLVRGGDPADGTERFGIYANAYRLRLVEALAANYPMLQTHLGQSAFAEIALAYLDAHPSTHISIRHFGNRLSSWLEETHPAERWLGEFAALEWALDQAFDASDANALGRDALASVQPDEWASLQFEFSTALSRLMLKTNAGAMYEATANASACPEGRVADATHWIIWRRELRAQYRSLTLDEAVAIDTLLAGGTFADACERLAGIGDEETVPVRAAAFLKRWLLDDIIVGFGTAP